MSKCHSVTILQCHDVTMFQFHNVTIYNIKTSQCHGDQGDAEKSIKYIGRIISWLVGWQVGSKIYWWQSLRENLLETSTQMESRYLQLADEVKLLNAYFIFCRRYRGTVRVCEGYWRTANHKYKNNLTAISFAIAKNTGLNVYLCKRALWWIHWLLQLLSHVKTKEENRLFEIAVNIKLENKYLASFTNIFPWKWLDVKIGNPLAAKHSYRRGLSTEAL